MSKRNSRRTCEICGVKEVHLETPLFFANFPLDENRCKKWVQATGKTDLLHLPIEKLNTIKHVCVKHFKSKDLNKNGNRLKKRAVPSLNLMMSPLSDAQMSEFPLHFPTLSRVPPTSREGQGHESTSYSSNDTGTSISTVSKPDNNEPSTSREGLVYESTSYSGNEAGTSVLTELLMKPSEETCNAASTLMKIKSKVVKRKITESEELSPRKKKIVEQLAKTKCTLRSLRKSALTLEKIESPVLKELVINACQNESRKPRGRRWTTKHKLSCLAILKRSPKTYRYLSTALTLPSVRTLQNILGKIPMQTGISQNVLNHLKSISDTKDEKDRICCLVFDEIGIKSRLLYNEVNDMVEGYEDLGEFGRTSELANHAIVMMLQGLHFKFKQPIAYYFTKGTISSATLAVTIKNIINKVSECGFTVLNTVCDQGPTNIGAIKILRDSSGPYDDGSNHYFKINGNPVFIVYDIPHLFKSIRNNFMNSGRICMNQKIGKWEHIKEVETHNRNFLYLSKITPLHVNPKYRAKMKVKLAAQILSNTVAAVLKLLARGEPEGIANELLDTAHVIEDLDRLFDATNGPSGADDIKKNIRENVSDKSSHMEKWSKFIRILHSTTFLTRNGNICGNVKCVNGYIISLKSLRDIWLKVKALGYKYLNLRNLNQDALENLFGMIRQHSPTNRNPTASHFTAALKTSIITGLTAPHSRGGNCENDNKKLLTNFHNFVFSGVNAEGDTIIPPESDVIIPPERDGIIPAEGGDNILQVGPAQEFPILELPEVDEEEAVENNFTLLNEQAVVYVAGYIAKTILKHINCVTCQKNMTVSNPEDNAMYTYIFLREWWHDRFSMTYPSLHFCNFIKILIDTTEKDLLPHLHERNICLLGCTLYSVDGNRNTCFACKIHGDNLAKICAQKTCKLLIRRQCQRVNLTLASKEEDLANKNKKAEQQGRAK